MKIKIITRSLFILALTVSLAGCVSVDKNEDSPPGPEVLDRLQQGMAMEEVIRILGRPTSLATLGSGGPEKHGTN